MVISLEWAQEASVPEILLFPQAIYHLTARVRGVYCPDNLLFGQDLTDNTI